MNKHIELRSDTFTKPTPEMMEAIMSAEVGDDVFGEDETVNKLEQEVAHFFGFEAALFCPSGTMSNQIAIKCHTQPGDEVICEKNSHIYQYEGGGIAVNSGVQAKLLDGVYGKIEAAQIGSAINPDDVHKPISRLVSLENTSNRGGGAFYTIPEMRAIRQVTQIANLNLHLDGARVWNAIVANQQNPKEYSDIFDSVSVCFNKGMGCPIGSVLMGNKEYIKKAKRVRKYFGGGMRQAGYMAAACLYALRHNIPRLEKDHAHAKAIGEAFAHNSKVKKVYPVQTNIVIVEFEHPDGGINAVEYFKQNNIKCLALVPNQIRMVTHLDVSETEIEKVVELIKSY